MIIPTLGQPCNPPGPDLIPYFHNPFLPTPTSYDATGQALIAIGLEENLFYALCPGAQYLWTPSSTGNDLSIRSIPDNVTLTAKGTVAAPTAVVIGSTGFILTGKPNTKITCTLQAIPQAGMFRTARIDYNSINTPGFNVSLGLVQQILNAFDFDAAGVPWNYTAQIDPTQNPPAIQIYGVFSLGRGSALVVNVDPSRPTFLSITAAKSQYLFGPNQSWCVQCAQADPANPAYQYCAGGPSKCCLTKFALNLPPTPTPGPYQLGYGQTCVLYPNGGFPSGCTSAAPCGNSPP